MKRIASIDVFRGLTMLVMMFVNDIGDLDLGHVQNAPWWLVHTPKDAAIDYLTIPDVIFPTFLFIVGLSIPLALDRRIARGDSRAELCWHIVSRATALMFIGVCMVNRNSVNEAATGMSGPAWRLLFFLSVIVFWQRYPEVSDSRKWLFAALRVLAAAMLIYLVAVFRQDLNHETVWLRPRWWGILGMIGWAYLIAAFVWLACRDHGAALMGAFALLFALNIGAQSGALDWWEKGLSGIMIGPKDLGVISWLAVAGLTVATLFRPNSVASTPNSRIAWMLVFAAGFAAAGFLLRPLWGINRACTPSMPLCALAIACTIYPLLYWIVDVKRFTGWTVLIGPAGGNALLMYMLHFMLYSALALFGITYLQTHFCEGWLGVARSAVIALSLVTLTSILSRCRIRPQL
jgi:heparan-alpha-glucosaminide N-acetyltransferase